MVYKSNFNTINEIETKANQILKIGSEDAIILIKFSAQLKRINILIVQRIYKISWIYTQRALRKFLCFL
ncbi:MAG: hypothetical protein EAY66_03755 [Sphingobacteriales bacterium]|nr:MAG: hypothetical protein EAY66_03755 [Sphingobacteriales bacterium]